MKLEFSVKDNRTMGKCINCGYNPKNMKIWQRIKNFFESHPTVCALCIMREFSKKVKK